MLIQALDINQVKFRYQAVQLAKKEALQLYQQHKFDAAIEKARQGYFAILDTDNEEIARILLESLMKTGRYDEAAEFAFVCVYFERDASQYAYQLALDTVQKNQNVYWHLTLAYVGLEEVSWIYGQEESKGFIHQHLQSAKQIAPNHHAILWIEAQLLLNQKNYQAALPLLEKASQCLQWMHSDNIFNLLLARIHVHGLKETLERPAVFAEQAGWNYNVSALFSEFLQSHFSDVPEHFENLIENLKAQYGLKALSQMESFFATGQGQYKDSDIHCYSMCCNNMAIYYRHQHKEETALVLHQNGIIASPFAEHYEGIMWCYFNLNHREKFIDAAENLFQFAHKQGYSRHNPNAYFLEVANTLWVLKRHEALLLWLERLEKFNQENHYTAVMTDWTQAEYVREVLRTQLTFICLLATTKKTRTKALNSLNTVLDQAKSLEDHAIDGIIAQAYQRAQQYKLAYEWYKTALEHAALPDQMYPASVSWKKDMQENLKICKGLRYPWWQIWR